MSVQTICPGCGVELRFATGAPLRVCDHCHSVVARRDRDLTTLGKVADLALTASPLELNLAGRWRGASFTLVGRAQIAHGQGGLWDEWYAAFDDGRWGWLAEAQGKLYLTFDVPGAGAILPAIAALAPGQLVAGLPGNATFVVAETGAARRTSAAGEIPYQFRPGESFQYADLSGDDGAFATLDEEEGVRSLHAGREVTLAELGWADRKPVERAPATVKADRVACPECDGSLELVAPDRSQRVGCPYCGTLSEVTPGSTLAKLELARGPREKPALPLGAKGTLRGLEWKLIGHVRKGTDAGYSWDEYLLYRPAEGFRWLICAGGHWSFAEPLAGADADTRPFRRFQWGAATIQQIDGELYWKASYGDRTETNDYIKPPLMLSSERSGGELAWTLGTYLPVREVERAFGVDLPAPEGIGPHQPFVHGGVLRVWPYVLVTVMLLALTVYSSRGTSTVVDTAIDLTQSPAGTPQVWFSPPFQLRARRNLEVELMAPLENAWAYAAGDLVDEATGLVQEFDAALEYYSGNEGGEFWSEGDYERSVYLSALPAGQYTLRLEIQSDTLRPPRYLRVVVRQGVPRWSHLGLLLLGVSIIPLMVWWRKIAFEKKRWAESGGD